jgi:uncharacterized 2Fe-2S/4Fe-4S cluster protein (DUF4445 family)
MTMLHLFRGIDWPLGVAPTSRCSWSRIAARLIGLPAICRCLVHVLPGVGGHLVEITASVVALGLPWQRGLSLFMDLGTNGESSVLQQVGCRGVVCGGARVRRRAYPLRDGGHARRHRAGR